METSSIRVPDLGFYHLVSWAYVLCVWIHVKRVSNGMSYQETMVTTIEGPMRMWKIIYLHVFILYIHIFTLQYHQLNLTMSMINNFKNAIIMCIIAHIRLKYTYFIWFTTKMCPLLTCM